MHLKLSLLPTVKALILTAFLTIIVVSIATAQISTGSTTDVTVYKCRLLGNGLRSCEKIAGNAPALPLAELSGALRSGISAAGTIEGHQTARCRVIGTGPSVVYIVCG